MLIDIILVFFTASDVPSKSERRKQKASSQEVVTKDVF